MKKTFQVKEVWIHIIVWVCLISFPLAVTFKEFGRVPSFLFPRILLNPILVYVNYLILVPQLLVKRKIVQYISLSILTLVLFIFLMNYFIPAQPFNNNMVELKKMAEMPPFKALSYMMTTMVSLAFFLLGGLLGLTKYYYKREKVTSKKEVQRQETELQFLRAQLNPHFLFNSLNSIYSLVRNKSNDAPEAVITLSELMRYMLYEAKRELVPLIKEIHYIKNFVQLQIIRLSHSENVKLRIKGDYDSKKIPPLLLIPFVENAFKYGTDFKGRTDVNIHLEVIDDTLFFIVKNKIGVYNKNTESSGIGLKNIQSRLKLLYPEEHVLKIAKEEGYYNVQLELNLSE